MTFRLHCGKGYLQNNVSTPRVIWGSSEEFTDPNKWQLGSAADVLSLSAYKLPVQLHLKWTKQHLSYQYEISTFTSIYAVCIYSECKENCAQTLSILNTSHNPSILQECSYDDEIVRIVLWNLHRYDFNAYSSSRLLSIRSLNTIAGFYWKILNNILRRYLANTSTFKLRLH